MWILLYYLPGKLNNPQPRRRWVGSALLLAIRVQPHPAFLAILPILKAQAAARTGGAQEKCTCFWRAT